MSASAVEVIEPTSHLGVRAGVAELWRARDLLYLLARRDVAVRYKQALFGFAWAIVQPVALALLFTVFLRRDTAGPADADYAVFALAGLVPWTFFANAVTTSSESLVGSANLVSKVYFPRLSIPLAALLAWLPDIGVSFAVLVILSLLSGVGLAATVVLVPLFILFTVTVAASVAVWTSAVNVAYRDVKYAVPFLVQLWLFATPSVYSTSIASPDASPWYGLNPMVGAVGAFRWAALGTDFPTATFIVSVAVTVVLLTSGVRYFRRVERYFADVI